MKVENLELEILQVGTTAAQGIDKLAEALKKLNRSTNQTAIVKLNRQMQALAASLNQIDDATVEKISKLADAVERLAKAAGGKTLKINYKDLTNAAKAANGAGKELSTVKKVIKGVVQGFNSIATSALNAYKPVSQIGSDIKSIYGGILNGAASGGWVGAIVGGLSSAASVVVKDYSAILNSFVNMAKIAGSKYLKSVWDTVPVVKFTKAVKGAVESLRQMTSGLTRIAVYRIMRTAIKEITSALEEGIEALYLYDETAQNVFAPTMDNIKSMLGVLKSNVATLAANLINLLAPAINSILTVANNLVVTLSNLFAALGGGVYYSATMQALKYAKATDKSAKSAKELKNQLMGFDEINKLNDTSSSSTAADEDQSDFAWEESLLPDWAQLIKNLIDNGNWAGAGFSLANHLVALVKQFDAIAWGKALGEKIQNGINFALGFFTYTDLMDSIGATIANALNGIIASIDGGSLGELLANVANSLWSGLYTFVSTFDLIKFTEELTDMLNTWISRIDATMIANTLVKIFGDILDAAGVFIENFSLADAIDKFAEFTKTLFTGIADKIKASDISEKLMEWVGEVDWDKATTDIADGINALLDAFVEEFNGLDVDEITRIISMLMEKIDFAAIADIVAQALKAWLQIKLAAVKEAVLGWASTLASSLYRNTMRSAGYKTYADGGIVKAANGLDTNQEGQLFIAREAGPELVGTFGSHTGVMNNDQIVAAVSTGVYEAVSAAMSNRSGNNGNITLNINGRQFARAVWNDMQSVQREHGTALINA